MYRPSDPQRVLFDAGGLLPPGKQERCKKTWAEAFRLHALPILRKVEDEFADLFDAELGRPNRPVELVLGTLILKEMSDLTDEEALEHLDFDALWWWAFQREPHELQLCQKTLHNFRAGLIREEKSGIAFRRVTDDLAKVLKVAAGQQRLDSTHILSNIALLTRLGLLCETIRLFLKDVSKVDPKAYGDLPKAVLERHGEESRYADARKEQRPRRLEVVARDLGRLIGAFEKNEAVKGTEGWSLLERLFKDQCRVTRTPRKPKKRDDDHGDGDVAVELKPAVEISSDSLQSPHDAAVTYSGHKGKGYSAQVIETCSPENPVNLITAVALTPACVSDAKATLSMVQQVVEAGLAPDEVVADTAYSGAKNAADLAQEGVNLLAPAPGPGKPEEGKTYPEPEAQCPKSFLKSGDWLRCQEASSGFQERYAIRAGIEATNSELKRKHGLGRLRVRGEARVALALYFKALACNVKRALKAWLTISREGALTPA
jgi:hypothetical protein